MFYLRLWGVPESAVGEHRDELATAALEAIKRLVTDTLTSPAAETVKPSQLMLRFSVTADGVVSMCKVEPVAFSAGCWWKSPPTD